jgi:hypothetical protein
VKDATIDRSVNEIVSRRGRAFVLIGPGRGPAHRDAFRKVRRRDWDALREGLPKWDLNPSDDPVVMGREQATRLAAEVRGLLGRAPAGVRQVAEELLGVLRESNGLIVSGVLA